VYSKNELICGLQIKPKSYTYSTAYLQKAKKANRRKNQSYSTKFLVQVHDVISTTTGFILNEVVLFKIQPKS